MANGAGLNPGRPLSQKEKALVALALSGVAGFIDVLGYLLLFNAFVAHMSGNTVSVVLHGLEGRKLEVLHRGLPILAFFSGLLIGELVLEAANRRRRTRVLSRSLAIEAGCLAAFLGAGIILLGPGPAPHHPSDATFILLTTLIAVAMGVQNASLRKVGAVTVFTTHITGTLTKLASDLGEYLFWLHDRTRHRLAQRLAPALRLSPRQASFQGVMLLSGLYLCYAFGAAAGAMGLHHWGLVVVAAPLAVVVGAIALDLLRPITPIP